MTATIKRLKRYIISPKVKMIEINKICIEKGLTIMTAHVSLAIGLIVAPVSIASERNHENIITNVTDIRTCIQGYDYYVFSVILIMFVVWPI